MVIKSIIKLLPLKPAMMLAAVALLFSACEGLVYDKEGDCVVNYRLRFVYNKNLKWADAFPSEVHSVHLYAFDSNGLFVKEFMANGEEVDSEDYRMLIDLTPGKYTLVAWCGMENEGVAEKSFTVPVPVAGQTRLEELTCALNVKSDSESAAYSDTMLRFLYHGMMELDLPNVYNGDFDYTMYLTKDTNHIRVILQQLSGEDMDSNDFDFRIEDANGLLGYDNDPLGTELISYRPWDILSDEAGIIPNDGTEMRSDMVYAKGVIADLSTNRLLADHQDDFILTVTGKGKKIAQLPIMQYALMSKEYYEMAYDHNMTEQDFLDRQDEYIYTIILDEALRWLEVHINILSWRVVVRNYEI
ncbi:MAG: FimB/Mfa2 family fimbrial subunit [Alistipes sp.]|nr:FimB/Mfa2 family fimbrial subunit [Alistipes sp.]